jgi:NAD(P)-dependent dehydrogenase (short-subunit alcohol dehydrogenase family)
LGARVCDCELSGEAPGGQDEGAIEEAVGRALADGAGIELLVVDSASVFARAIQRDGSARDALRDCLDSSWNATRVVANAAFMPDAHGGRIVYLAPPADAGEHADAARAGLENLARTLSIEWARHGITLVAIAPGAASGGADAAGEVAALAAYLASPAGAYFSGCVLDLRGSWRYPAQKIVST